MALAPRRRFVIITGDDMAAVAVRDILAARHKGRGVFRGIERDRWVGLVEGVVLVLLVVEADDIDRLRHIDRLEHAAIDRRRHRTVIAVERLDRIAHAADHFIALRRALHRLFVEHRPQINARMIAVAPHHPLQLLHIVRRWIEHAVLIHDEETHAVGQFQQVLVRRVVRRTDGVDAQFLEALQAIFPQRIRHGDADAGMILVNADALHLDMLVIEEQAFVGIPMSDAEAGFVLVFIDQFTVLQQPGMDGIEIRLIDRPQLRIDYIKAEIGHGLSQRRHAGGGCRAFDHGAGSILQFTDDLDRRGLMADIVERHLDRNLPTIF